MSLLRNSSDTQLHVANFPNYSKPLNVAGTHFSGTHMPGITKQSLRRASVTPSAQPAASAELCSFPLLNIHCAQMQYILNIRKRATQGRSINPSARLLVVWEMEGCQLWGEGQHCFSSISQRGGARGGALVASQQPPCMQPRRGKGTQPRAQPTDPALQPSAAPGPALLPSLQVGLRSPKLLAMHFFKAKIDFASPKCGVPRVAPSNISSSRPLVPSH